MLLDHLKRVKKAMSKRIEVVELGVSAARLRPWFSSDFGRYINGYEERILTEKFSQLPGYRLLGLSATDGTNSLGGFAQLHRFSLHPSEADGEHSALCDYRQLPIPSGVVDVALLKHGLEFSASPKAVLAEVCRVVMPGGHIILCIFNPFGCHGSLKFFMQMLSHRPQYGFHNLRCSRVIDWLSLLSFQVLDVHHGAYRPFGRETRAGAETPKLEQWLERVNVPLGNVYIIHAVKRELKGIGTRPAIWAKSEHSYGRARGHIAR